MLSREKLGIRVSKVPEKLGIHVSKVPKWIKLIVPPFHESKPIVPFIKHEDDRLETRVKVWMRGRMVAFRQDLVY